MEIKFKKKTATAWAGGVVAGLVALGLAGPVEATERRFTYTYQSGVLTPGQLEIEPWTTVRLGRDGFYNRFDERLEFEVGVTERLQWAWYLNFKALSRDVKGLRETSFDFVGVSWEWKLKLLDPVADAIGLALYWELSGGPSEAEVEAKVILDKRIGNFLIAFNLVGEYEIEFEEPGETVHEFVIEADVGAGWFFTPSLFAGLELRSTNAIVVGEGFEHSTLFLGPTVSYSQPSWWVAVTLLPQIAAFYGATNGVQNLGSHERFEGRLVFGIHL